MAFAENGPASIFWRENGDPGKPVLLLLNLIGSTTHVWDWVVPQLERDYRLLRLDARGHGGSSSPDGEYSLDDLARDVLTVLDAAQVERAAVCGVSLGGMIAMNLALMAPARVSNLILACTSARMDPAIWRARIDMVRAGGMAAAADLTMQRYFTPEFAAANPQIVQTIRQAFLTVDPAGYRGCCAAIRDMRLLDRIAGITAPALVISGDRDIATPFMGNGSEIVGHMAGASHVALATAHAPCVEAPALFADTLRKFLRRAG